MLCYAVLVSMLVAMLVATVVCHVMQCNTMSWYGVLWCNVVQYGIVWHVVVLQCGI